MSKVRLFMLIALLVLTVSVVGAQDIAYSSNQSDPEPKRIDEMVVAMWNEANPDINNPINANVRPPVYCNALRIGGQAELDFLQVRRDNSLNPQERQAMYNAFGCSPFKDILEEQLNLVLEKGDQDSFELFNNIYTNSEGKEIAVQWFNNNKIIIEKRFSKLFHEIKELNLKY